MADQFALTLAALGPLLVTHLVVVVEVAFQAAVAVEVIVVDVAEVVVVEGLVIAADEVAHEVAEEDPPTVEDLETSRVKR